MIQVIFRISVILFSFAAVEAWAYIPNSARCIHTEREFDAIRSQPKGVFKLCADIVFTRPFSPIEKFNGSLFGEGHTLSNLQIQEGTFSVQTLNHTFQVTGAAIFHQLGPNSRIENLDIGRSSSESSQAAAILALSAQGTIKGVHIYQSSVRGDFRAGGLAVDMYGLLHSSSYSGRVTTSHSSAYEVGGLIGHARGNIFNSFSAGSVQGAFEVGGLVGKITGENLLSKCHSSMNVSGREQIGGLVGESLGSRIEKSYATGNVSGVRSVGGLVGWHVTPGSIQGGNPLLNGALIIEDSYSTGGAVTGDFKVGGLVGELTGQISRTFSTKPVNGIAGFGGLVGTTSGFSQVFDSFYLDTNQTGGGIGFSATLQEMTSPEIWSFFQVIFGGNPSFNWQDGQLPVIAQ